ncbi:DUF4031 domain-containing protein [Micrococcoides hystricis]|uniref:DUF4031 domain-containing protein n=1 Tax=Micrococcoides hystricis TaxID=1572761 RepID=A0ABV6PBT0_9MICC
MALFIDPPQWPAHGTVFSHLISDESVDELHAFAEAVGLSRRAFDGDHYDVPAHRYPTVVALGAREVTAGELVRRLTDSGLRIRAAHRPSKVQRVLKSRFGRLFPVEALSSASVIRDDLLYRWAEPHRSYHDQTHLLAVLNTIDFLERHGESSGAYPRALRLAAWFHDAVYLVDGAAGEAEEASAQLAERTLSEFGLTDSEVEETARLVRLTTHHRPENDDEAGALFSDADLEVLGRAPALYERYRLGIMSEYGHLDAEIFTRGRAAVLRTLLEQDPLYNTRTGRDRWETQAKRNLAEELQR